MNGSDPLTVLVVEDEMIVGMDIAMTLEDAGFTVAGPFKAPDRALAAIADAVPDFAILDLNLGRDLTSEPVAEALQARGCPFVFLTGYGAASHPVIRRFEDAECLSKPVDIPALVAMVKQQSG